MKSLGNDEKFIKLLDKYRDNWIDDLDQQKGCKKKIKLSKGEFLSDKFDLKNIKQQTSDSE